ncbi:MAG: hypothetical protein EAY75_06005 [Bacteroidetes bacterium]|nr:MAG: hypothetical protein EAY75_06005 [Bacteroidota bacterium]
MCVLWSTTVQGQETSLLDGIADSNNVVDKISGAFKSSRVIHAHSIEMISKGNLDFRILHRFGEVSDGIKTLFGLDQASMRMSFDYGISDNFTVGFGRSTYKKEYDAFLKYRIVQQSRGAKTVPVSVVVAAGALARTANEFSFTGRELSGTDKTSFYVQAIVGRKFNQKFSMQLSPMWLHMNYVDAKSNDNDVFGLGGGARYKLSKHLALTLDYHHVVGKRPGGLYDPLAIGVDIETGGHVFQLHLSNAVGMNERAFLYDTDANFLRGDIRFGFNLSRMFDLRKFKR